MPIYEYHCDKCDNTFEDWTPHIDDQSEKPCPKCGSPAERIISHTSFVLKGGGWYVTDYGYRKGKTEDNKPVKGTASAGEATSTSASSATPAASSSATASAASTSASSSAGSSTTAS